MIVMDGKDVNRLKCIFEAILKRLDRLDDGKEMHVVGCGCTECDRIKMYLSNIDELGKQ